MSVPVKIYDKNLNIVADLQNAHNVSYTKRLNEVWDGSFDLPADDDKNDLFDLLYFAELFDGGKRVGLFRINRQAPERTEDSAVIHYECKHVLDTLNDDQIVDKVAKTGTSTAINYILGEQTNTNWQLGTLDFNKNFEHEFRHQTLLRALLDVPQPWWEDYELTFNTQSHPWTLNLVQPDESPKSTLRYGKNIASIEREIDAEKLVTELYAFGDGSGDDQVSAGPFTSNTSTYGTHVGIWEEQYFDNESDLATAAKKYLDRVDTPRVEYRGQAADLYQLIDANRIEIGEYLSVYDEELNIDTTVQVVELSKNDVKGSPGEIDFTLNNQSKQFPNYGALAFRDKATEDNLATGSVSGGAGGALATGGTGTDALANEAVTWDKIKFKDDSGDYMEQTRLKIDALVTFENNFTNVDKLDDGDTYAKMRKEWRSASDVTKIAGGEIYTDSIDLNRINFSPTASKNIVGQINANDNGVSLDADIISITGNGISVNASNELELVGGNAINITASGIETDESEINLEADQINLTGTTTLDSWQYETSTTIDGGQIEADTLTINDILISGDIDMSEGGTINSILNCESITGDGGSPGIALAGNDVGLTGASLSGNITMNTYNITDVGTVDGVDVSAHANNEKAHQELLGGADISINYGTGSVTINFTGTTGSDTLDGLNDTNIGFPSSGQYLGYDGSDWTNKTIDHNELDNIGSGDHVPTAWSENNDYFVNAGDLGQQITVTDTGGVDRTFYMVKDAGTAIYYVSH